MEYIAPIDLKIAEKLRKSEKYRRAFFKARCRDEVVLQIKALRKERRLSQEKMAKRLGMVQSAIVRIEDPDYAQWSFTTLQRVAEALDACWEIRLRKSEEIIDEAEGAQKQEQRRGRGGVEASATTRRVTVTFETPRTVAQFAPSGTAQRRHFYSGGPRMTKDETYINVKAGATK